MALLLVPLLVYGMVSGRLSELTGPGGWGAKFTEVKNELEKTKEEVRAIDLVLKTLLTKHELGLLKNLNDSKEVLIHYEPDLYMYLHRLDGLDLIRPNEGYGLFDIVQERRVDEVLQPEERPVFDIKKYVHITKNGIDWLNLLDQAYASTV